MSTALDVQHADIALSGTVERVVFRNQENGYSVLSVRSKGLKDPVTVVGKTLAAEGEIVHVTGVWKQHAKFGRQLEASRVEVELPKTPKGVERYLASGIIPGIGPGVAKKLVAAFGGAALDILEIAPEKVLQVPGIGPKTAQKIREGWAAQREAARIVSALAEYDIGIGIALRIYRKFGADSIRIIQSDPYKLTAVQGVGFLKADAIARAAGIPVDAPSRLHAGLRHVVSEATERGSTGVQRSHLLADAEKLLGVSPALIEAALADALAEGRSLKAVTHPEWGGCVFARPLLDAESEIAVALEGWARQAPPWKLPEGKAETLAAVAAQACGVTLADEQRAAVVMALTRRVSVLTGGPGTGKTSTLKVILEALRRVRARVIMGAPTGKAAKRMREATGEEAATIARLTGMGTVGDPPPIAGDILILDEVSMVDVRMLRDVLRLMAEGMALLLVGDVDQLPSVGPGRALADIIDSGAVPVTRLTQVFRQAAQSAIVRNAHRINQGQLPERAQPGSDFFFIAAEPERIAERVVELVSRSIPSRFGMGIDDIQVLSPMRRTPTGAGALNAAIQKAVNPNPGRAVERGGVRYGVGDRVLQTVNNYDLGVMNGETGIITDVDHEAGVVQVNVDGVVVRYPFADLDQLDLAYAMSVHKSQGSQFPAVVMPITTQHYVMLQRPIVYTAVTRAVRLCVLVGQPEALRMAVANTRTAPRVTLLRHLLAA